MMSLLRIVLLLLILVSIVIINTGFKIISKGRHSFKLQAANVKVNNLDNKKSIEIESGAPLSLACVRTDLRLSFQCKQGHCLSCEVNLDGKIVRACQTKVPAKKSITIKKKV